MNTEQVTDQVTDQVTGEVKGVVLNVLNGELPRQDIQGVLISTTRIISSLFRSITLHCYLAQKLVTETVNRPPPYKKARKISGPFLLPEIPNPRGVAGIEAAGTNLPERAKTTDFWLSPVSFLCFAAGTFGLNPWFFKGLARPFCSMSCTPVA